MDEQTIVYLRRRLEHCELGNEWFKVEDEEVLLFLTYLVRAAYEASMDIKYVVLPSEYCFIREFCKRFAFNGGSKMSEMSEVWTRNATM